MRSDDHRKIIWNRPARRKFVFEREQASQMIDRSGIILTKITRNVVQELMKQCSSVAFYSQRF